MPDGQALPLLDEKSHKILVKTGPKLGGPTSRPSRLGRLAGWTCFTITAAAGGHQAGCGVVLAQPSLTPSVEGGSIRQLGQRAAAGSQTVSDSAATGRSAAQRKVLQTRRPAWPPRCHTLTKRSPRSQHYESPGTHRRTARQHEHEAFAGTTVRRRYRKNSVRKQAPTARHLRRLLGKGQHTPLYWR